MTALTPFTSTSTITNNSLNKLTLGNGNFTVGNVLDANWGINAVKSQVTNKINPNTKLNAKEQSNQKSTTTVVGGKTVPNADYKGFMFKDGIPYEPVQIEILTGKYANLKFDLGTNASEIETSQSADWEDLNDLGVRSGAHFQRISHREISFSVDYYLPLDDVSPLVENWATLHELTASPSEGTTVNRQPPLLIITVGKQRYGNCVMTQFNAKYDAPMPGKIGMRHAVVNVSFICFGGLSSVYQTAPPYAPTPLQSYVNTEAPAERERRLLQAGIEQTLNECIGDEATRITDIVLGGKANDANSWLNIKSPGAFVQAGVGGMLQGVLNNDQVKTKLKNDLAKEIARKQASFPQDISILENALKSGTQPNGGSGTLNEIIPSEGITNFQKIKQDFDVIYDGIVNNNLKNSVLGDSNKSSAQAMLYDPNKGVGLCGAKLLEQNFSATSTAAETDQGTLTAINNLIARKSDDEIAKAFNVPEKGKKDIVAAIKKGHPYSSKTEFYQFIDKNVLSFSGASAWSGFNSSQTNNLQAINNFIKEENTTITDIQQRMGVDADTARKIKNGGISFASLEKFYGAAGGIDKGVNALMKFSEKDD